MHAYQYAIFGFNMRFLVTDPFLTVVPYQSQMIFIIICWFNRNFKINWHPSMERNCILEIKRKENKLPTLIEFHAYRRIKQEKKCNGKKKTCWNRCGEISAVVWTPYYEFVFTKLNLVRKKQWAIKKMFVFSKRILVLLLQLQVVNIFSVLFFICI